MPDSKRTRFAAALTAAVAGMLTVSAVAGAALPDNRGWEMVSPVDKNGGQIDPPGGIAGGGVLQAAIAGGAVSYSSAASFGPDATGAPPASQYVSTRANEGWATQNITTPVVSGSYGLTDEGVPYQLFSIDLARGLLFDGKHCRGEATGCAVANPPLPGTDAPTGFQNYYLREGGSFEALIGAADIAGQGLEASTFDVHLVGAAPDLRTIVLSSCSPLTPGATDGCGTAKENLYEWSQATGNLTLVNPSPGAQLGAQSGAVSRDGARIYWRNTGNGNLYLSDAGSVSQVDTAAGGGGTFQTASEDGTVAFFTKAGHLWRFGAGTATDLTPGGGVVGVLGGSADGSVVYFQDGSGLQRWDGGTMSQVAPGADAADAGTYPPASGAARVSSDGEELVFLSREQLTGYDNTDQNTALPDSEVFLYDASGPGLTCVSCNPSSVAPIGPSTIPGAVANGTAPGSLAVYKPRVLSANGKRVFFDSADALVQSDSNANPVSGLGVTDTYEWEAEGEGTCAAGNPCVAILSNGALPQGASFVDASSDGGDAFFLTSSSLVKADPGSQDVYDARVNGGFPVAPPSIPCEGDACQILPAVPRSPTLATVVPGLGNPAVVYHKYCRKGYVKRKQICVVRGKHRHKHRKHGHHGGKGR